MAWTYTGNPASSEKDLYRFTIGDTIQSEPILSDEEIQYILSTTTGNNARLYLLYQAAANKLARECKRSLGPQAEDPTERTKYFSAQAAYFKRLMSASGISVPTYSAEKVFDKGMHDNV